MGLYRSRPLEIVNEGFPKSLERWLRAHESKGIATKSQTQIQLRRRDDQIRFAVAVGVVGEGLAKLLQCVDLHRVERERRGELSCGLRAQTR